MLNTSGLKIVFVDLLCWGSIWKVVQLARQNCIEKVLFFHRVSFLIPLDRMLEKIIKKPVVPITDFVAGEERINGMAFYEALQLKMAEILDRWVRQEQVVRYANDLSQQYGISHDKFLEYIKQSAYPHVMKPIELFMLGQQMGAANNSFFLIRKTPFAQLFQEILGVDNLKFYRTFLSQRLPIKNRKNYVYDVAVHKEYYSDRWSFLIHTWVYWWSTSILAAFYNLWSPRKAQHTDQSCIIVELSQCHVHLDEINDVFWLEDSNIDPKNIYCVLTQEYDEQSISVLKKLGVNLLRYFRNPLKGVAYWVKCIFFDEQNYVMSASSRYVFKSFRFLQKFWWPLFNWNEQGWVGQKAAHYYCRSEFWKDIYAQFGIKLLWSMHDIDEDKVPKAQSMEFLDGIFIGGHWSHCFMRDIRDQKCYDVMLVWGEHFVDNILEYYPFLGVFSVGYFSDHYFRKKRHKSLALRQDYPDKFLLLYLDNTFSNDLPWSKAMQVQIYQMLVSVLKEYGQVTVFLKPKKKQLFDKVLKELPDLQDFYNQGRIRVFFQENSLRVAPAEIGMASDLVIGYGLSTAACECSFAGTITFHAELMGFIQNNFVNKGLGKVVFKDIESLRKAVIEQILSQDRKRQNDFQPYYRSLDPFQDGKAYKRVGFILKKLQEGFNQGLTRFQVVEKVKRQYHDQWEQEYSLDRYN